MTEQQQRKRTETVLFRRSTAMLVVGSLLSLVDRSSASLQISVRPQNRVTRAHGAGSDSVNETQVIPALTYAGEPPLDPNVTYGACEGRCSRHEHCQEGLFCIQRLPNDEIISTCLPPLSSDPNNSSVPVTNTLRLLNYCAEVPENELVTLTEGNTTDPSVVTITTACSGGCVADSDCIGEHLKCSQPTDTTIPGCSGHKHPLVNYCYFDNSTTTTTSNSTNGIDSSANTTNSPSVTTDDGPILQYVGEPPFPSLLLECQGDCDSDWQCDFGLNCFKRSDDAPIPGCSGAGGKGDIYSVDYCYTPPSGTLVIVQNVTTNSTKAGKCEGNCKTDVDCVSGLICYLRQNYEEVPGCKGLGAYSTNYCYDPADDEFNSTGTLAPSKAPVAAPVPNAPIAPISVPTALPTQQSNILVPSPTIPVVIPTTIPSVSPSKLPNGVLSGFPSTSPSSVPSNIPVPMSSTVPSSLLSSFLPSETPSFGFDALSSTPSENPTVSLSENPSEIPTIVLSEEPSENPIFTTSSVPSLVFSETPSENPIFIASLVPSDTPSAGGDNIDRDLPTLLPTRKDGSIVNPPVAPDQSLWPSLVPSSSPSFFGPSVQPSDVPTVSKSSAPSSIPSSNPSEIVSSGPSFVPNDSKSSTPSSVPSSIPSEIDSSRPSFVSNGSKSSTPSSVPSSIPSGIVSSGPSFVPVDFPSSAESSVPSSTPSDAISSSPSSGPSRQPTIYPSSVPSGAPVAGGLVPDDNCPDFAVLGRARAIFQRLMNVFQYIKSEIVYSNETNTNGNTQVAGSYQQAAFDWLVNNDEQIKCSNSTKLIQRYALAAFWFATGGDYWSISDGQSNSFLSKDVNECQWNGISCDDSENVIGFHLDESNITGTLPIELASLQFLRELNIDTNHLTGPIPSWFGRWKNLEVLDLDHNQFTGSIPSSLYSIPALRVLDLDSNALTGTISEAGIENWIDHLYFLQLDFNEFVGTIPSILGKFSNLQYLSLFGNNFTSTILSSIENLCEGVVTIYANCNMCQNSTCCTACLDI